MKNTIQTILVILLACVAFGLLRTPIQEHIIEQERTEHLIEEPIENLDTTDMLEQQLVMASLGGLRSLVAAVLSMDAFDCFLSGNWEQLERRYNQITNLDPHMEFYWDTGAWHLGNNASSAYLSNRKLSAPEQQIGFKNYINKGRAFLEKGVERNPKSWYLYSLLGNMYSDIYRRPNFEKAAQAYHKAVELGAPLRVKRNEFYALARTPSKTHEAWRLGRELYQIPQARSESLINNLFALENRLNLPQDQRIPFRELYPTDEYAKEMLSAHLGNTLHYPIDGVRKALDELDFKEK